MAGDDQDLGVEDPARGALLREQLEGEVAREELEPALRVAVRQPEEDA